MDTSVLWKHCPSHCTDKNIFPHIWGNLEGIGLQSHIWLTTFSYMVNIRISSWLCNCSHLNFLIYEENIGYVERFVDIQFSFVWEEKYILLYEWLYLVTTSHAWRMPVGPLGRPDMQPTNGRRLPRPPRWSTFRHLKVHKNKNFFGFDFEFITISLIVLLKY